eukprot:6183553-Pleurochrysis_carterae.AAC.2
MLTLTQLAYNSAQNRLKQLNSEKLRREMLSGAIGVTLPVSRACAKQLKTRSMLVKNFRQRQRRHASRTKEMHAANKVA